MGAVSVRDEGRQRLYRLNGEALRPIYNWLVGIEAVCGRAPRLDGFIAGPDGSIDWAAPDEELMACHMEPTHERAAHLCGSGVVYRRYRRPRAS